MMDWFLLLPYQLKQWLIGMWIIQAKNCPGHSFGKCSGFCSNCGLRKDAIERARELKLNIG